MEKHKNYCYRCVHWIFNGNYALGFGYCSKRKMSYRRWCQSCPKDFELNLNELDFVPDDSHTDIYKGSTRNND